METRISLDDMDAAVGEFQQNNPDLKPKPTTSRVALDDLDAQLKANQPPEEKGFWKGVGTAIAGSFKKSGKGLQLEATEYQADEDELLKGYYADLGRAQRSGNKKLEAELTQLISETREKIKVKNSAPAVVARVQQLQSQIQAINEDISGARPQDMGFWKSAAFDAATSVGVMGPALGVGVATGGAGVPLALTTIGMQTYASSYGENRSQGLSREKASQLAAVDGLTESLTELLPASKLLKNTGLFKKFLESTVADVPGEIMANYIQSATDAVAGLGESPTDDQIKETLARVAKEAAKEIPSVAASTAMAGGALAAGVRGVQRMTGRREEAPSEKPSPVSRTQEEASPAEPPQEAPKPKPHYRSPKEALEAMQAQTQAGSEFADLDALLAEAQAEGKARTQVPPKDPLEETQELFIPAEEGTEFYDGGDTAVLELPEVPEDGKARGEVVQFPHREAVYERKRKELEKAWIDGDVTSEEFDVQRKQLDEEARVAQGRPTKEEIDASIDQQIAELDQDFDNTPPMSDEDLLALYQDSARRQRVSEFSGPAPIQPRLTGDKMVDRRLNTRFMKELREWAGEMLPMGKGSVSSMKPRAISPTDKVSTTATRLMAQLRSIHTAARPMWDLLGNRAAQIAKSTKAKGLDPSSSVAVPAKQVLARLSAVAEGPFKNLIEKLQEFVPEEQIINFQWVENEDGLVTPDGQKEAPRVGGIYIGKGQPGGGQIYMKVNEDLLRDSSFTKNVMHELWHAVTYEFMAANPEPAVTQKIKELYIESFKAVSALQKELSKTMTPNEVKEALGGGMWVERAGSAPVLRTEDHFYGMTNHFELVAEAMSNPAFMHLLAKASPRAKDLWSRIKAIFHEVVGTIAEALGFNKNDAGLLHEIFSATEDLLWAQKNMREGKKGKGKARARAKSSSPYNRARQLKTRESVTKAMKLLTDAADKVPGVASLRKQVGEYLDEVKRNIAPETLGPKATQSATVLSKHIVNQMRQDASFEHQSQSRRAFWEKHADKAEEFIRLFESGWTPKDPEMAEVAKAYREWNQRIIAQDIKQGIAYDERDNYLYHVFKKHDSLVSYMNRKYGKKWGDPGFIKDRKFNLYEEAKKAGFVPLYKNPEDIMLARQHASDVAQMKIGALQEMYQAGLAWTKEPRGVETVRWRAPNGEIYFVHHEAAKVLHNAWNTQSLWSKEGLVGGIFRGAMYLKNRIVPIKLSLSLFHFLHVLTINNATGMLRATKGLMLGNVSPAKWLKEMGKAALYTDLISSPRFGGRIRAVFRGEISPDQILPHEALAIQYMIEGGMLPEQSHQYKSNAKTAFANALRRAAGDKTFVGKGRHTLRAAYEAPFAAMDWMQHWMFEKWIPSIKTTSYLNEVKTALESDPSLVHDQQRRQIIFHKLAKSVDNRHGEMVYKTMFWNKWIKDTAVVNLLSLGWQMGFIREYGGAIGDLKDLATKQGDLPEKIRAAKLDRPIFVTFYTAQALMYGGLLSWALSGEPPEEWKDYIYPKDGTTNKDGTPGRVNTMFYPREFSAIAAHVEQEGLVGGLTHTVINKASGIYGLVAQSLSGVDDFGAEYRDPNGEFVEKVAQTLDFVMSEMTPISVGGIKREGTNPRSLALNVTGFSKAPGYATRGKAEAAIRNTWQKYNAKTQTPFERAAYSEDMRELRDLQEKGEDAKVGVKMDEMISDYSLTPQDRRRIWQNLRSSNSPEQTMFRSLTWQQQKRLLDEMTPEERDKYLPFANRAHIRFKYEAPEEE